MPDSIDTTIQPERGRIRLGMVTPSSNTVLEPVTSRLLHAHPAISLHASRFRVTAIGLSPAQLGQFDAEPMLAVADLLADAKVHSILWNGTSAAWLGTDSDEAFAAAVTARTGIPASTTVLGFHAAFRLMGLSRIGLVTPYTADVQARIGGNWAASGFPCVTERHLGLSENFAFALVTPAEIAAMTRAVAAEGADCAAILCTNLDGAGLAAELEAELGIPVLDSVAVSLWQSLRIAGADPAAFREWGSVFTADALRHAA